MGKFTASKKLFSLLSNGNPDNKLSSLFYLNLLNSKELSYGSSSG
jgi:hypothetical protein